jgi:hypothetical protein
MADGCPFQSASFKAHTTGTLSGLVGVNLSILLYTKDDLADLVVRITENTC